MSEQDGRPEQDEEFDPRLTEEDRQVLARLRKAKAEAKAAGRWAVEPMDDPYGKFSGPFGVDKDGNVVVHHTVQEARRAAEERERERRRSVEEQLRNRTEGS
jgi:hypothetical protein